MARLRRASRLCGALLGLAMLSLASGARAQAPAPGVAIADLVGLSPTAVRARLAGVGADWPAPPAFQMATSDGALSFLAVDDLMLDPVLARRLAVFRTRGDNPGPWTPYVQCRTVLQREGRDGPGSATLLVFRDGRLESAFGPPAEVVDPPPRSTDPKVQKAYILRPRTSPFLARSGELPLQDGGGFLSRWRRASLGPADRLAVACSDAVPPPAPPPRPGRRGLDASDLQGLALLPFAATLPSKNRQRETALRRGPALLQTLRLGDRLPAPPARFAAEHAGVRAYPSADPAYAVLSIDLGGYAGRNLTNNNDAALVGVRGGAIEWIAPPARFGPTGNLLCLDERGVPAAPRPGCSGWGHFSP